jgi:hypothetical protein
MTSASALEPRLPVVCRRPGSTTVHGAQGFTTAHCCSYTHFIHCIPFLLSLTLYCLQLLGLFFAHRGQCPLYSTPPSLVVSPHTTTLHPHR